MAAFTAESVGRGVSGCGGFYGKLRATRNGKSGAELPGSDPTWRPGENSTFMTLSLLRTPSAKNIWSSSAAQATTKAEGGDGDCTLYPEDMKAEIKAGRATGVTTIFPGVLPARSKGLGTWGDIATVPGVCLSKQAKGDSGEQLCQNVAVTVPEMSLTSRPTEAEAGNCNGISP